MKLGKNVILGVLTLSVVFYIAATGLGFAQDTTPDGQYKIAVVDRKAVYDAYEKQQDQMEQLDQLVRQREQEIDQMLSEVQEQQEQFEQRRASLSETEALAQRDDIERDLRRIQRQHEEWDSELNRQANRLISQLQAEINEVVEEIGIEENYHLILDADPNIGGVLYHSSPLNMTSRVIERINSQYRAGN